MLALIPAAARAQVQTHVLTKPEAEHPESFTSINAVRELRDGRVIVVGLQDRSVQLVDLRTGRAEQLGRTGKGPGEYSLPVGLVSLGGGSLGILDEAARRIVVVLPDGKLGRTFRPQPPPGAGQGSWENMGHADERGRMYAEGSVERMVRGAAVGHDSVPIVRWMPGQPGTDTMTWVRKQGTKVSSSTRGLARQVSIRVDPFAGQDAWAVAADGRIAVADPVSYQISWTDSAGRRTTGPPIPFTPLKFTEAHKEEWRAKQRDGVAIMVNGDDGSSTVRPARPHRGEERTEWPAYLPPFLCCGALRFAPDGRLWVRRSGVAGAPLSYDVIDRQGRVVQRVELPKHTQLMGFGATGAIYVVRTDDDGLQYLQRHRIP